MLEYISKISLFVCAFFVFSQSYADYVAALYDIEVLVTDESAETRSLAFKQGLDEVFVRISGDSIVMDKLPRPVASRYVKQFSYEPILEPVTNTEGEQLTHKLTIQYNGNSMEKYLMENGFAVWNKHRPEVVVWVVVRDGVNEYVLKDYDESLLKSAANDAFTRRGIPERWPIYDAEDKNILSVADIRGGFKEPVIEASKRYSKGPALTGSIIWNGRQWQSNWSLLVGNENSHWSLDDVEYDRLINNAIDQAADALGMVYAIRNTMDKQKFVTVQLDVQAVNSIEKYRYIENYLSYLNVVEASKPLQVDNQNVIFEVTLRSTEEDFINLIKNDTAFSEIKTPLPDSSVLQDKKTVNGLPDRSTLDRSKPVYRYKLMK